MYNVGRYELDNQQQPILRLLKAGDNSLFEVEDTAGLTELILQRKIIYTGNYWLIPLTSTVELRSTEAIEINGEKILL